MSAKESSDRCLSRAQPNRGGAQRSKEQLSSAVKNLQVYKLIEQIDNWKPYKSALINLKLFLIFMNSYSDQSLDNPVQCF